MKKVTLNIYEFEELSEKARDRAKKACLEHAFYDLQKGYENAIKWGLERTFPNSNLRFQYSLSYSQGDGFNLYGSLNIIDACEYGYFECPFTCTEIEDFRRYMKVLGYDSIELPRNETRYSYCYVDHLNFYEDWYWQLQELKEPFDERLILNIQDWIKKVITDLCSMLEHKGYNRFYEVSNRQIKEMCRDYKLDFYEDGTIYKG